MVVDGLATLICSTILAKLLNYKQISTLISDTSRVAAPSLPASSVRRAVERAARVLPGATCVPQALAVHWMLARRGYCSKIVIGVERNHLQTVSAHAWVESGNVVVIGGTQQSLRKFQILLTLGANRS